MLGRVLASSSQRVRITRSYTRHRPDQAAKVESPDVPQVYDEVARLLAENDEYDNGSYAPVLLRLSWHPSGTYDGLKNARKFLEPVKQKFAWILYSDFWTLGVVMHDAGDARTNNPMEAWLTRPGRVLLHAQRKTARWFKGLESYQS